MALPSVNTLTRQGRTFRSPRAEVWGAVTLANLGRGTRPVGAADVPVGGAVGGPYGASLDIGMSDAQRASVIQQEPIVA